MGKISATYLLAVFFLLFHLSVKGQTEQVKDSLTVIHVTESDIIIVADTSFSGKIYPVDTLHQARKPIPAKATIMSAVLPGLGQIYNRKYWKVPLAYALIGTSTYFLIHYQNEFQRYRRAYIDLKDGDVYTNSHKDLEIPSYQDEERIITYGKDLYRKYRDYAIIAVVLSYLMNVVDANVDAHLFDYNVDDNLSIHAQPKIFYDDLLQSPKIGVNLCFSF
ncbi:MAG: DUF5683 domain-containing protein [Bacteroidales bacterium]|jgi:hypothetical protein|nr:DUF5683 domain-containing protein [Bacteroidales bacterium]